MFFCLAKSFKSCIGSFDSSTSPKIRNQALFDESCRNGDSIALQHCLDNGSQNVWLRYVMTIVAQLGTAQNVQHFLGHGANVNQWDYGSDIFGRGMSPLMYAVRASKEDIVKLLVEKGANVNHRAFSGTTALHEACRAGHISIVKTLLDSGADHKLRDMHGETPLLTAALNNRPSSLQELIVRGADVRDVISIAPLTATERVGAGPLHLVARPNQGQHDERCLQCLLLEYLRRGYSVNNRDSRMNTPLHLAIQAQRVLVVKMLIDAGANLDAMNSDGKRPLSMMLDDPSFAKVITELNATGYSQEYGKESFVARKEGGRGKEPTKAVE